jgi:hypothetical protein
MEWGIIYNLQILFFRILEKNLLSEYMENNTLNGETSIEINHNSVNNRIIYFRSSLLAFNLMLLYL